MTKKNEINERKQVAASYIVVFAQEVNTLTHFYSNYENILLEIEHKYNDNIEENITPEEKETLQNFCKNLRYYTSKTDIAYKCIMEGIEKEVDAEVKNYATIIKKQYIVKRDDIEKYVILLNKILMNNVIKNLLESSSDIIEKLYGESEKDGQ